LRSGKANEKNISRVSKNKETISKKRKTSGQPIILGMAKKNLRPY
jgi:hypothetical protein